MGYLELGLPCIGEPPYYLVQRMERIATHDPFAPKARREFVSRIRKKMATNSLTKIFLKSMHFEHFFGFGQNFRKMAARILPVELGLPCKGEPPYYLVQRIAARI